MEIENMFINLIIINIDRDQIIFSSINNYKIYVEHHKNTYFSYTFFIE